MIENINLDRFEIVGNFVMIKVDPDYDFVELSGPDGTKISLQIIDNTVVRENTKNISITGTVLKTCEQLLFHGELKTHEKGITIAGDEFESLMRQTMPHDVDMNVNVGDNVIFDFKLGVDAEIEGKLYKDEKAGYCMLAPYEMLFAKIIDGELIPLTGWVFFIRDQKPGEYQTESGLWVCEKVDKYGILKGTVVCADKSVRMYIDRGSNDNRQPMPPGERIILQRGFGFRVAHDLHAGKFKGIEAIKRKNILATFTE